MSGRYEAVFYTTIYSYLQKLEEFCEFFEREIVAHKLFFRRDLLRL